MTAPLSPGREAEVRAWLAELGARKDFTAVGPYNALRDALAELDRVRIEARVEGQRYDEVAVELDQARHDLQGALGTVDRERERADKAEAQGRSFSRALAVIVKHGDMSETVRQELRDLLADTEDGAA